MFYSLPQSENTTVSLGQQIHPVPVEAADIKTTKTKLLTVSENGIHELTDEATVYCTKTPTAELFRWEHTELRCLRFSASFIRV